jgi:hypothetical protein
MIKPLFEHKIRVKPLSIATVKIWTFLTPASRKRGEGDRATERKRDRLAPLRARVQPTLPPSCTTSRVEEKLTALGKSRLYFKAVQDTL